MKSSRETASNTQSHKSKSVEPKAPSRNKTVAHKTVTAADDPPGPFDISSRHFSAIQAAAYYMAEKRGFGPGHEMDDWLAAEAEVNAQSEAAFRQTS